jgi:eukaryotic-like serine/threonine-protein kinase
VNGALEKKPIADPYRLVGGAINGKYLLEAALGIGGMGVVYLARHTGINRKVALKLLKPDIAAADPSRVDAFRREAILAGGLVHPHIINVTDADVTSDGLAFMVMELLECPTLEDELSVAPVFSIRRTERIIEQICSALHAAHQRKIVHRDLKPSNVALQNPREPSEHVKVLDFGIAKSLTAGGNMSQAVGTPLYASPEQFSRGALIDERADIYSLGVIAYQLLTGRLPFQGDVIGEVISQHFSTPPPPLRQHQPLIPIALETLVLSALAKNPADRPSSAREFAERFKDVTRSLLFDTIADPMAVTISGAPPKELGATLPGIANVMISVIGAPPRADVTVNGWAHGKTDETGHLFIADLTEGMYVVEVRKLGFHPWKTTVHCHSGETREIRVTAQPSAAMPTPPGGMAAIAGESTRRLSPPVLENQFAYLADKSVRPAAPSPLATKFDARPTFWRNRRIPVAAGAVGVVFLIAAGGAVALKSRNPAQSAVAVPPAAGAAEAQEQTAAARATVEYRDTFERVSGLVHQAMSLTQGNELERLDRRAYQAAQSQIANALDTFNRTEPAERHLDMHRQMKGRYDDLANALHNYEVSLRNLENALSVQDFDITKLKDGIAGSEREALMKDRVALDSAWNDVKRIEERFRREVQ